MRRKTVEKLSEALSEALEVLSCHHQVIEVVEIADYPAVKRRDEKQLLTIATLEAERAQLRMLLKEALGQLSRIFETTKTASPEYRRLVARSETVLAHREVESEP